MCSITFLPMPAAGEFVVLMNRDEQRQRARAHPPDVTSFPSGDALYPREPGGGTWIAGAQSGIVLALMNWMARPPASRAPSRGRLIPELLGSDAAVHPDLLSEASLQTTNPFRLFRFQSASNQVEESRWDGERLEIKQHPWILSHWFSSGFAESAVVAARSETARRARTERDYGSVPWARRLHAGHLPNKGAYSLCMHRPDAKTVSLTEIHVTKDHLRMAYLDGSPCAPKATIEIFTLPRSKS